MADGIPSDNSDIPEAMVEFDNEWTQIRIMATVCNQMYESFTKSGFTEEQALRLTAFMVKED